MGTVILIASGKGGTGKTSLTGGVSVALANMNYKVLCIDADIGLRNLDIVLGMTDSVFMDFSDVMEQRCTLQRAVAPHPSVDNLFLLTAPLTLNEEEFNFDAFKALLDEARTLYDYILIDCPAGLGLGFELASFDADEAIIVSMNDFSAVRDAQRVVFKLVPIVPQIRLVVNRTSPKLLRHMGSTIDDVMDAVGIPLLGIVPDDPQVLLSSNAGKALLLGNNKKASRAYRNIAKRISGQNVPLMKIR